MDARSTSPPRTPSRRHGPAWRAAERRSSTTCVQAAQVTRTTSLCEWRAPHRWRSDAIRL